ncbi:chorismate mutase [Nonomuraea maritima]|uniref:chorismate mutase n=1 Tax=Nonomuraea maritima TaxID=683260 RepID=UPI0037145829
MSSTLERHAVAEGPAVPQRHAVGLGELRVGEGPAVVIRGRVSLRGRGHADASAVLRERHGPVVVVEPATAADLPAVAELADGVVVGASWTRDIPLVRAAAALGLPVVVERRPGASLEEWLGLAGYCAAEGDGRVILCETGRPDLGLVRAARSASGRPVLVDVSCDPGLSPAAVAAGADGLILAVPEPVTSAPSRPRAVVPEEAPYGVPDGAARGSGDGGQAGADWRVAEEAVTLVGALLRDEAPTTLPACRQAIDRVDAALATLLERRAALAGRVQQIKPVGGFAGRDADRERAVVERMAVRAPRLGQARLTPIMNAVIEAGLHLAEERAAH